MRMTKQQLNMAVAFSVVLSLTVWFGIIYTVMNTLS